MGNQLAHGCLIITGKGWSQHRALFYSTASKQQSEFQSSCEDECQLLYELQRPRVVEACTGPGLDMDKRFPVQERAAEAQYVLRESADNDVRRAIWFSLRREAAISLALSKVHHLGVLSFPLSYSLSFESSR